MAMGVDLVSRVVEAGAFKKALGKKVVVLELVEELEVGDWLWFPSMGAYTRATASEFNGFPKPEVFVCDSEEMPNINSFTLAKGVTRMPPVSAKAFFR